MPKLCTDYDIKIHNAYISPIHSSKRYLMKNADVVSYIWIGIPTNIEILWFAYEQLQHS
jgi:hypothetical protein